MTELPYYTVQEAIQRLSQRGVTLSASALTKAARSGRIQATQQGRTWFLDKSSVDAYVPRAGSGIGGGRPRATVCTCGQDPHRSECSLYRSQYRAAAKKVVK